MNVGATSSSLDRIQALVAELVVARPYFASLEPVACSRDQLDAFERRHRVELPPAHRALLLALGDRPLLPRVVGSRALGLSDDACLKNGIYQSFEGRLCEAFPYAGELPLALPWDELADDYVDLRPLRGTICLGSGGCDIIWVAVITGRERGRVWCFVPGHEQELQPTGLDLLAWWIDSLERALRER